LIHIFLIIEKFLVFGEKYSLSLENILHLDTYFSYSFRNFLFLGKIFSILHLDTYFSRSLRNFYSLGKYSLSLENILHLDTYFSYSLRNFLFLGKIFSFIGKHFPFGYIFFLFIKKFLLFG
jgi:hypothetical protein